MTYFLDFSLILSVLFSRSCNEFVGSNWSFSCKEVLLIVLVKPRLRTTISKNLRLNQEQNEHITFWILIYLISRSEKFHIFGCHLSDAAVVHYY